MFRVLIILAVLCVESVFSTAAFASCRIKTGILSHSYAFTLFPPIDADVPLNSELARSFTYDSTFNSYDCTSVVNAEIVSGLAYLGDNLYDIGMPGVALKIIVNGEYLPVKTRPQGPSNVENMFANITLILIKVGNITRDGVLYSDKFLRKFADEAHSRQGLQFVTPSRTLPITLLSRKPTCAVTLPTVNVNLGHVSMGQFGSDGRSPDENFSIDLLCSGGDPNETTDVYVSLSDQSQPANRSTRLSLTPGSSASGVVLEVKNKNGLVQFGEDTIDPTNPARWHEGATSNGNFSIPLSVNYLIDGGTPSMGTANAVATYTLTYQ